MDDQCTTKQMKILQALNRIHRSVGANLELETISRILVEELVEIVGCTGCALLLLGERKVHILGEHGFSKMLGDKEFTVDMPAIKHIVDTRQCIATGDIANSPASSCVPAGCHMKSLMCIPVVVKDRVRGIIHLDSPEKDAFDAEDIEFVEHLADAIAISVERALEHSKIRVLSVQDDLTGCYNRRKLDEDIDSEIDRAKRYERVFSIIMLDVDWFKRYNDHHGHGQGDELLKKLASLIKRNIRAADTLYRYGGEEFSILLPETSREQATAVANKLQKTTAMTPFDGEQESQPGGKLTVSIGLATYPWDGNNRDELLKSADTNLYRAKKDGRNTVCGHCRSESANGSKPRFCCDRQDEKEC